MLRHTTSRSPNLGGRRGSQHPAYGGNLHNMSSAVAWNFEEQHKRSRRLCASMVCAFGAFVYRYRTISQPTQSARQHGTHPLRARDSLPRRLKLRASAQPEGEKFYISQNIHSMSSAQASPHDVVRPQKAVASFAQQAVRKVSRSTPVVGGCAFMPRDGLMPGSTSFPPPESWKLLLPACFVC